MEMSEPKSLRGHRIRESSKRVILTIFPGEQRSSFQHLRENASRTPDIHGIVILLPRQHDLGGAVIPCRDVSGHLRVLKPGKTEVTNLEITILVDQDVAGFLGLITGAHRVVSAAAWNEIGVSHIQGRDGRLPRSARI